MTGNDHFRPEAEVIGCGQTIQVGLARPGVPGFLFARYPYAALRVVTGDECKSGYAAVRLLSSPLESTDSARALHSLDSPAILPVESGLPIPF